MDDSEFTKHINSIVDLVEEEEDLMGFIQSLEDPQSPHFDLEWAFSLRCLVQKHIKARVVELGL